MVEIKKNTLKEKLVETIRCITFIKFILIKAKPNNT